MKTTNKVLALALVLTATSQAATTISGITGSAYKAADGTTNIISGALVMLIADSGGDGFLNLSSTGAVTPGLAGAAGKNITVAQAGNFSAGSSFGGDTVVTTSLSGSSGSIGGILTGIDISPYVNKNFAIVWFNQAPASVSGSPGGQTFGMMRLSDWVFPSADAGATFTMSSTDAGGAGTFYSSSANTTATQVGGGFFTGSGLAADTGSTAVRAATFSIVPEPSAALLGAIGALGLLRRRRI